MKLRRLSLVYILLYKRFKFQFSNDILIILSESLKWDKCYYINAHKNYNIYNLFEIFGWRENVFICLVLYTYVCIYHTDEYIDIWLWPTICISTDYCYEAVEFSFYCIIKPQFILKKRKWKNQTIFSKTLRSITFYRVCNLEVRSSFL